MSEADLGMIAVRSDFKGDLLLPLFLGEVEMAVQDEPGDPFVRDELDEVDFGILNFLDPLPELSPTLSVQPSTSSPHHPRTLLMASKTSFGVLSASAENVGAKS
jgi:hypothetical protein